MEAKNNGYHSGSNLEKVLRAGHFAVTVELGPPKSADGEVIRKKAALLRGLADAVNITDNQTAIVRMSSIAAGRIALEQGLEPVMQMTCRDRNRLAMQSDLLGAYALGLRNVLCLTGDHHSFGNHPQAKNVHDLDSTQLVRMVTDLRDHSAFQCGEEIKGVNPRFFVGVGENPFADPAEWRPLRLGKKVTAGADLFRRSWYTTWDASRSSWHACVTWGWRKGCSCWRGWARSSRLERPNTCGTAFRAWTCRRRS